MSRRLNEDADRYCMFWLGIVLMSAYFMEFIFKINVGLLTIDAGNLFWLFFWPIPMAFLFSGYFTPERGKTKNLMLALAVVAALMYMITSFVIFPWAMDEVVWYASWGIGSAIVTAGGAAMISITTDDEAYTPGIMDVGKLHYGPPDPEPEVPMPDPDTTEEKAASDTAEKKENEETPVSSVEATE